MGCRGTGDIVTVVGVDRVRDGNPSGRVAHRHGRRRSKALGNFPCAIFVPLLILASATAMLREEATVDQLKERVSAASVPDKVHLCVQIAERQLDEAHKLYGTGDIEKAQPLLVDVTAFSELARDYSIQSNKHQKQTEISIRAMARKLTDILHTLGHDDQGPVRDAIGRLERARDDLLISMFPKGAK